LFKNGKKNQQARQKAGVATLGSKLKKGGLKNGLPGIKKKKRGGLKGGENGTLKEKKKTGKKQPEGDPIDREEIKEDNQKKRGYWKKKRNQQGKTWREKLAPKKKRKKGTGNRRGEPKKNCGGNCW